MYRVVEFMSYLDFLLEWSLIRVIKSFWNIWKQRLGLIFTSFIHWLMSSFPLLKAKMESAILIPRSCQVIIIINYYNMEYIINSFNIISKRFIIDSWIVDAWVYIKMYICMMMQELAKMGWSGISFTGHQKHTPQEQERGERYVEIWWYQFKFVR